MRVLVNDFRRSWRFYRDVLGLRPVRGHGQPPYGEFATRSGAMVSLFERKRMAEAIGLGPGRYDREVTGRSLITFEVPNVDRFAARLRRRKIPLVAGPTDRPEWRLRTIHLQDPDGYLVEVYNELKQRRNRGG